ncbi:MAG: RnfABCDGE type electron transport complex subunit D [Deltaproteobacteria bacterium]|nr:RnfABCDGE type electron transport complex subunit D [Deltaproteobacteria bacterium]
MPEHQKLIVSHAPFWHNCNRVTDRSRDIFLAALPAALFGVYQYGVSALGVLALSVSSAVLWELAFTRVAGRPVSVGDGTAAVIGLLLGMMLPASMPWWGILTGTFLAVVVARQIYGGIGANPFNPVAVALAILMLAWKGRMDFDAALVNYPFDFPAVYHLTAVKAFGTAAIGDVSLGDLLLGRQIGGIGCTFGLGLILGGVYLLVRGVIRWEITLSMLAGVALTAFIFNQVDPAKFASPAFHLLTGYTLIGAFFLAPEDPSSPVNFLPMLIYGAVIGSVVVFIRDIGVFAEGLPYAVLVGNLIQPLVDKIRPKALGKVV